MGRKRQVLLEYGNSWLSIIKVARQGIKNLVVLSKRFQVCGCVCV